MKAFFKNILILFIITCITVILFFNFIEPEISNSNKEEVDTQDDTSETQEPEKEDLVELFYRTIIRDDTSNESFGDLGDSELDLEESASQYGLAMNLEVYDTNDNSTIDLDENTPVKMSIINSSDKDYTIKDVRIDGDVNMFDDSSFSNLETENIQGQNYSFNRNRLSNTQNGEFTLKAGDEASFYFDAKWTNAFIAGSSSKEYLQFNFSAYNETLPAIYFELGVQTYSFSSLSI